MKNTPTWDAKGDFPHSSLTFPMKSTLVKILRWTSRCAAVAAKKIEMSTAVEDGETWVKKTSVNAQSWAERQLEKVSSWLSSCADRLETTDVPRFIADSANKFWTWINKRADAIGAGSLAILCGLYALMFFVSIFFNSFIGMLICGTIAVMLGSTAVVCWGDAVKAWQAGNTEVSVEPVVAEKKPAASVRMNRKQQRKAAARAAHMTAVPSSA